MGFLYIIGKWFILLLLRLALYSVETYMFRRMTVIDLAVTIITILDLISIYYIHKAVK